MHRIAKLEREMRLSAPARESWSASCTNCRYRLVSYGKLGTEVFATKHANINKHKVTVFHDGKKWTEIQFCDTLNATGSGDEPPF